MRFDIEANYSVHLSPSWMGQKKKKTSSIYSSESRKQQLGYVIIALFTNANDNMRREKKTIAVQQRMRDEERECFH